MDMNKYSEITHHTPKAGTMTCSFLVVVFQTDIGEERSRRVFKKSFHNIFCLMNHFNGKKISMEYQMACLKQWIFFSTIEVMISCNL